MKPRFEVAVGFGENLRRLRRRSGLSQEELNFRSSVHRTDISKIERGESLPRTDTLLKLAGGLGVEPQELLDGLAWEPPPAARLPWGCFRVASQETPAHRTTLSNVDARLSPENSGGAPV